MVVLNELSQGSSSSSSSTHDHNYDVFLSFRGADTRNSFTDHLYNALLDANITTFLDDAEIPTGECLKPELESAIKSSRASIIVLSENYAYSRWCLDELVLILEQHRNFNQIVIPIFYHVEPTNVRKQQDSFGAAMAEHKQRMEAEANAEKRSQLALNMEVWIRALTEVADLKGKDAKDRKETEFIEEIVADIQHRLGVPSGNLPLLIGMADYMEEITSWLRFTDKSYHSADILTILGMGGIGKTTLAKYVYELHSCDFQRSRFIDDISRRCAEQFNGLLDVQKQLCDGISKPNSIQVYDVSKYTSMIENAVARKKVFLVLDDIDSIDQLDALLGNKDFCSGSKIIITTKDASLTKSCALFKGKAQPKHRELSLRGLYKTASRKLLCHHAFICNYPKEGYEEVSENIVKYCEGHPLALEVLGKSLHNRDVAYWEECLKGLKKETHFRIKKALQMSFDSLLTHNDKELFKHIACFFVGKDREYTETILKACGMNTISGITHLIDRCLLSIRCDNTLMMHQLLQEMGRDAIRQESPNKPWKRSRLWCHDESYKVLKQKKGSENLLGLTLDMRMLEKEKLCELNTDALGKMDNLMLLKLNYVQINGSYENFPQELRWLCMHGSPLKSIPSDLPMENLVALDMSYSNIESFDMSFYSNPQQLWKRQKLSGSCSKDKRLLGSLKILNLSFCEQLLSLGGFVELPALEKLIVTNCVGLSEFCESIEKCVELVLIDMSYCNKLEKLPTTLGKLKKVKTLLLVGCDLHKFQNIGIDSLTSSSAIVESIPNEQKFFSISLPSSLVKLSLANNNLSNESFPKNFSCLSMLKTLNLDGNPIVYMPNCVSSLPRLEILEMNNCQMLMSIKHPPCTLTHLGLLMSSGVHNCQMLQNIVFDPEMSPLSLVIDFGIFAPSSFEIEGMFKIQPMVGVEEKVLCSLGWTNLEFIKNRSMEIHDSSRGKEDSQIKMYYEFGIFSTIYGGDAMPNWIKHRIKGPSISFTIPPSPNNLGGLNFSYVQTAGRVPQDSLNQNFDLPKIIISNITRNHTWIYIHYIDSKVNVGGNCLTFLSHWMFGMNEMGIGDLVTITVRPKLFGMEEMQDTMECGVSFVYDDGNMEEEEDALGYYKSWNHIIGGDLSAFLTIRGEYLLNKTHFIPIIADDIAYKEITQSTHCLPGIPEGQNTCLLR